MKTQPILPGLLKSFSLLWQSSEVERFDHFSMRQRVPFGRMYVVTGPANVFLHISRCTCLTQREKVPQKCPTHPTRDLLTFSWNFYISARIPPPSTHTHTYTQTIRSRWKECWDLKGPKTSLTVNRAIKADSAATKHSGNCKCQARLTQK